MERIEGGIYLLPPPYTGFVELKCRTNTLRCGCVPASAAVVALRPLPTADAHAVLDCAARLRAAYPRLTVILWLDLVGSEDALRWTVLGTRLGIQGFVRRPAPDPTLLRAQLTDPVTLPAAVTAWFVARGIRLDGRITTVVEAVIRDPNAGHTLSGALDSVGVGRRAFSNSLAAAGGCAPEAFVQLLRLLSIAVFLQRLENTSAAEMASHFRYYDAPALRRRMNETLGAGPNAVRKLLGWEWLAYQAARRNGVRMATT